MRPYRFAEVRAALREHWGLALYRGGEMGDGKHGRALGRRGHVHPWVGRADLGAASPPFSGPHRSAVR